MKKNFRILAIVALGATLVGCAAPKSGRDDATYYYSNKGASAVAKVEPPAPPPVQNGPAGVSKIVYFDFDKYNIRPGDRNIVEAHASFMRNRPSSRVVIEATPTSAAAASTTWHSVSAAPTRCSARSRNWACRPSASRPSAGARKSPRRLQPPRRAISSIAVPNSATAEAGSPR